MKKIFSKLFVLMLAAAFCLSAFACAGSGDKDSNASAANTPDPNADIDAVYEELLATGNFPELSKVPAGQLMDNYGIDPDKLEDYVMAMPLNFYEDIYEIAIFKVKDEAYAKDVEKIMSSILKQNKNTSKGYSDPEQAQIIEPAEVVVSGNYCYLVVGKNYEDLMKIMHKYFG